MITAGSVRGKCRLASFGQVRVHPAEVSSVGVPLVPLLERDRACEQACLEIVQVHAQLTQREPLVAIVDVGGDGEVDDAVRDAQEPARCVLGHVVRFAERDAQRLGLARGCCRRLRRDHEDLGFGPRGSKPRVVGAPMRRPVERGRAEQRDVLTHGR
jgi:hypothetical protein